MVEGYPEMDDYEEAELVASGEINIENCEDAEAVSKILQDQGFEDMALDYGDYIPKPPYKINNNRYNNRYDNYSNNNRYDKNQYYKRASKKNSSDTEDLLLGLGFCLIPIVILIAIIYFILF